MDDQGTNGDGGGYGGGDDEPTVVIVPRVPRPTVSRGVRLLAAAFGQFRHSLYELADLVDSATAMGALELTDAEAGEIDEYLADAESRIQGVRGTLKRASGSGPTKQP